MANILTIVKIEYLKCNYAPIKIKFKLKSTISCRLKISIIYFFLYTKDNNTTNNNKTIELLIYELNNM